MKIVVVLAAALHLIAAAPARAQETPRPAAADESAEGGNRECSLADGSCFKNESQRRATLDPQQKVKAKVEKLTGTDTAPKTPSGAPSKTTK